MNCPKLLDSAIEKSKVINLVRPENPESKIQNPKSKIQNYTDAYRNEYSAATRIIENKMGKILSSKPFLARKDANLGNL